MARIEAGSAAADAGPGAPHLAILAGPLAGPGEHAPGAQAAPRKERGPAVTA